MRLIDADALMEKIDNMVFTADMTTTLAVNMAYRWIDNAPTVEAVLMRFHDDCMQIEIQRRINLELSIVNCGECEHWYNDADCGMACEFTNMSQPEDGYCNWGKRREDA